MSTQIHRHQPVSFKLY